MPIGSTYFNDPGGGERPTFDFGSWAADLFGNAVAGSHGTHEPSRTQKIRYLRQVGFMFGTDSPQYRAAVARYPNIARVFWKKLSDLPRTVASAIDEVTGAAVIQGALRDLSWARGLLNVTQAGTLTASLSKTLADLMVKVGLWTKAKAAGPFTRPKVGKGRQVTMERTFGKVPLPDEKMTVLGVATPDWLKQVIAWSLAQAGIQGIISAASQPKIEPESSDDKRKREEDRAWELEQRRRERVRFEEHEADRVREARERQQAADDREQAKRDAAAAAAAAAAANQASAPGAPKPLWLQVLLAGTDYFKQQAQRPKAARVTQSLSVPQSFPFPQPGLTGFSSGGVGSSSCECPTPKKKAKRRKQARAVCYTGRYIERADGIQKSRGRRVPCRPSKKRLQS